MRNFALLLLVTTSACGTPARTPRSQSEPPTRALFEHLADGTLPASSFVDPVNGLVVVKYITGELVPPAPGVERLCGDVAVAELESRREKLGNDLHADADTSIFSCDGDSCVVGLGGEGMKMTRYVMRATAAGPVIATVVDLASTYTPADAEQVVAQLRARVHGGRCTAVVKRCDPSGVWRVEWDGETLDVALDPALLSRNVAQVGFDIAACRIHVFRRWEDRYGNEGYEDADHTLRVDFQAGEGDRAVRGLLHSEVFDPRSETDKPVRGVARRLTSKR